uniref:Integrase catalytic domain-containing protein n=1 Tax=Chromera velia CCMP2878 TaxID=1169474 RepID=A0A0G4HSZ8_9ALVE|eukprot:Cvel_31247.t1-p1 / transcript=Cvel_31247.t1 / gene=Cvel_31247 / organism=Chromera_velia_CCMP2878 / gene_product=hypothetical protein / transcript_product=hypothetical protein / location=Cvel_scaffold4622:3154-5517(+) / protein_length=788 / sequence_SO=supercontig / SO=protein_coding / is_pseudo=false
MESTSSSLRYDLSSLVSQPVSVASLNKILDATIAPGKVYPKICSRNSTETVLSGCSSSFSWLLVLQNPEEVTPNACSDPSSISTVLDGLPADVRAAVESALAALRAAQNSALLSFAFHRFFAILDIGASRTCYTRGWLRKRKEQDGLTWTERRLPRPSTSLTANGQVPVELKAIILCRSPSGDLSLEANILETNAITPVLIGNAALIPLKVSFEYATGILSFPYRPSLYFQRSPNDLFFLALSQPPELRTNDTVSASEPTEPRTPTLVSSHSAPTSSSVVRSEDNGHYTPLPCPSDSSHAEPNVDPPQPQTAGPSPTAQSVVSSQPPLTMVVSPRLLTGPGQPCSCCHTASTTEAAACPALHIKGVTAEKKKRKRRPRTKRRPRKGSRSPPASELEAISFEMVDELIRAHHVEIGHAGVTKTWISLHRALKGHSKAPSYGISRRAVQRALQPCIKGGTCAHVKLRNVSDGCTSPLKVRGPRQRLQADLVYGRADRPNARYYLTLKDEWEDDLHYIAVPDRCAATLREAYKGWAATSAGYYPNEVITDLGKEFQGDWADFLSQIEVGHTLAPVGWHRTLERLERAHREVDIILRAIVHDNGLPVELWPDVVQLAVERYNRRPGRGDISPAERRHGQPVVFPSIQAMLDLLSAEELKNDPSLHTFSAGDRVLFNHPEKQRDKREDLWEDAIIKQRHGGHVYTIQLSCTQGSTLAHIRCLRPSSETSPPASRSFLPHPLNPPYPPSSSPSDSQPSPPSPPRASSPIPSAPSEPTLGELPSIHDFHQGEMII